MNITKFGSNYNMKNILTILISMLLGAAIVGGVFYFKIIPQKNTVNLENSEVVKNVQSVEKEENLARAEKMRELNKQYIILNEGC